MIKSIFVKTLTQGLIILVGAYSSIACSNTQASPDNDAVAYSLSPDGENLEQLSIINSLSLKKTKINSLPVIEISGIALDKDENILYAVSDEGILYHIKLSLKKGKLDKVKIIFATRLRDKRGKKLKGGNKDSEGLTLINANNGVQGDTKLIISFEGKPRIGRFTPKGYLLSYLAIPRKLSKVKNYRKKNKSLESVVNHPKYGILTASEYPLKENKIKQQTIYSASKLSPIKEWRFPASKTKNSAITDMEVLPNGDLLIMERAFSNPFTPIVMNLSRLKLEECDKKRNCKLEKIARFSSADGWRLDNFEGLTHIKNNQYLVVSDDNKSPFQQTLFVLFELKESE